MKTACTNMIQPSKPCLIIWLIISVILFAGFTIEDPPFDKKNKKILKKVEKLNEQAELLLEEADTLFSIIEQNNAAGSSNSKKLRRLELRANELQLKALKLQEESYLLENSVYEKIIPQLKLEYAKSKDSTSKIDLFAEKGDIQSIKKEDYNSDFQYFENTKIYNQYFKLIEAQQPGNSGTIKLWAATNQYSDSSNLGIKDQKNTSINVLNNPISLNEEFISAYLNYVNSKYSFVSDEILHDLLRVDLLSVKSMRYTWDNYLLKELEYNRTDTANMPVTLRTVEHVLMTQKEDSLENENKDKTDKINFKVQIATSKEKYSEDQLAEMYRGNESVEEIMGNDTFKYFISTSNNFKQAIHIMETVKAEELFILVSNFNADRTLSIELHVDDSGLVKTKEEILFKVQIAADLIALSYEKLHNIYKGKMKIEHFEEDSWFKYSVGKFKTYEEADNSRANCGVEDAFVIAYYGEKKMNVLLAKRILRSIKTDVLTN